jgi:hypothetical protein
LTLHAFCGETEREPADDATEIEEVSASPGEEEASRE